MVQRRILEAQRWQIIGMHTTGMFFKAIGRQMGYHYTVVSRLVRKHTQTNNVKDLPRSGRPRVTCDTVSNLSCWQISVGQPVLFEYGTGCEWHPSNQTLQCPVIMIRPCNRRPHEGLETQKYSPRNIQPTLPYGGGSVMVWGYISHDCKLDLVTIQGNKCFAQEVPEPVYDGLTCPKYALWDSNPSSWLAKEQKSRLRFGGRR
jgi:hypothetical protein